MDGRAREWLDAGASFDWGPLKVFHAEFGDPEAPVLLLIHGFPTSSIDWYDVVGPLSREHRLCVLDLPGFGFSDKPKGESYTVARDAELVEHYVCEVVGARAGAVVGHDRGDSVALAFAARCASEDAPFELRHLVLSNGNMFLPLSNLTQFQRLVLDPATASQVLDNLTPELLAAGMGQQTFSPPLAADDPAVVALAETFAWGDGIAVLHDTIQYLVERSEHEREWLESLARLLVPTTLVWGLYDTISPLRAAAYIWTAYLAGKPGENEFWLLPQSNHYLQHDQPQEFADVVSMSLSRRIPDAPGPLSPEPGAPILVDRSRAKLPTAKEVLEAPA